MAYLCPHCQSVAYPEFRQLWGHIVKAHKDEEKVTKEDCYVPDNELPEGVEIRKKGRQRVTSSAEEVSKPQTFEDEDAQRLYDLLTLHGIKESKANLVTRLYSGVAAYQDPRNLNSLLNTHLRGTELSAIPVIMDTLYPQRGYGQYYSQSQPGAYPYYGSPQMPGYGPPVNPLVETRLDKIEKVLEKLIDERDNQHNPELQSQVEALKAQLEDEKEKRQEDRERRRDEQVNQLMQQLQQQNERIPQLITEAYERANREHTMCETARKEGREEGFKAKATDFEGRVMDLLENQIAPGAMAEVKAGREIAKTLVSKIKPGEETQGASTAEPITDEEASKISEIMRIEEEMKSLAAEERRKEAELSLIHI